MLRPRSVKGEVPTGDLEVRALGVSAESNRRNVDVLRGDWNYAFLKECGEFPHGMNDDQVSAFAGAFFDITKGGSVASW
jgi:phage terminase large subunit-like protein